MTMRTSISKGVYSPVLTPFNSEFQIDLKRYLAHAQWLVDNQVGLAVFGTNSEANSLSLHEKTELLYELKNHGIDGEFLMPGTGCTALPDSISLTKTALEVGANRVLMLPPFYYKDVPDEGIYRYFCETIDQVANENLQIYLYHIPQVAKVGFSLSLIERLLKKHPNTIVGIKDSSGEWNNSLNMIDAFGSTGFEVYVGSESLLLQNLQAGGAGCISATANVNPAAIYDLYANWHTENANFRQSQLNKIRYAFQKHPMISAMKFCLAHYHNDPNWNTVRPPLLSLNEEQKNMLIHDLTKSEFILQ